MYQEMVYLPNPGLEYLPAPMFLSHKAVWQAKPLYQYLLLNIDCKLYYRL